ncbi:MAG: carbamoyltransferase [Acidobacteriota bacterium]|nr:carbamoyltransferase [Acidobacteriota bacterium]
MAVVLGINAVFHDPAAALVIDGRTVAAAEEERFSRIKHGKLAVPFSTWEMPERSARWCLAEAGLRPEDVDAVSYSYDPSLLPTAERGGSADRLSVGEWEPLRTLYAELAPSFVESAFPGIDGSRLRYVPHHVAHAASAYLAAPFRDSAVLVLDGRGETASHLAGKVSQGELEVLSTQRLPHSLGLLYEELTVHLGFQRSSDEYKVMALASYGQPVHLELLRELIQTTDEGGFRVDPVPWGQLAPRRGTDSAFVSAHADVARSVQERLEEVIVELAHWLHRATGETRLAMAGGVALNCVANSRLAAEGPFARIWVQPAAGDAGTALGGALYVSHRLGDRPQPLPTAALGRGWSDSELEAQLVDAGVAFERPDDLVGAVADVLAADGVVAWFQGRSEFGPRALGHRSLLANPGRPETVDRMNAIKGREQFRPVAPMVLAERASDIFEGPFPSPYMLFTHTVRPEWRERVAAAVHVDGSARVQTVDAASEPLVHDLLEAFEARSGVPVLVNTSFNTAGRPMVDDPRDALECFGSAPVDLLAIGPFLLRRASRLSPVTSAIRGAAAPRPQPVSAHGLTRGGL